jgi:hypothetical protein
MQRESTFFLRGAVLIMGLIVLALSIFVLPTGISMEDSAEYGPVFWGMYITVVPFSISLYQTLKLLDYIDKNKAFSNLSVKALGIIKYCAFIISGLYAVGMPFIYTAAQADDAPGVVVLGMMFTFASLVIGVFAAVLQKLLHSAIEIKSENDLTV